MNSAFYGMYQFIYQEGVVIPERPRLLEPFQDLDCSRVSTGRDVPGQKKILSRCPFVPGQGQEQMSRDKIN